MKKRILFILLVIIVACISLQVLNSSREYELYRKDDLAAVVSKFPIAPSKDKICKNVINDLNDYYGKDNYVFSIEVEANSNNTILSYYVTYSADVKSTDMFDGNTMAANTYRYRYDGSGKLVSVYYCMSEVHKDASYGTISFGDFSNVINIWGGERK